MEKSKEELGQIQVSRENSSRSSVESLMSTLIIDAYKWRDIIVYYFPGAFLQSDISKD